MFGPTHLYQRLVLLDHLIGNDEEGRKFRSGCGGNDEFNDFGESEEGPLLAVMGMYEDINIWSPARSRAIK